MNYELIIIRSFRVNRNDIITLGAQTFFETKSISIPMLKIALQYVMLRFRDDDNIIAEVNRKLQELNEMGNDPEINSLSVFCKRVITMYNELGIE